MNAVVYIVLASVSLVTVKAIKRIPINLFYQGNSNKKQYSEVLPVTVDAEDERVPSEIGVENIKNAVDSDKSFNVDLKFTDFILEVAKVLKTYENYDLKQTFVIIDYETWENMYKGCKSHELADIRRYVSDKLTLLKDEPADTLRKHLDTIIHIIRAENYGEVGDMVNFVNSLYVGKHENFIEVLLALVHRRISADINLAVILKHALKYLIFDHYCNLDNSVRHELIKMIKHYWNQFASQKVNETGGALNTLVTPFIYEKRNNQIHKKRRFNTVNEGRPLNKHDSEYSDGNISEKRMRAYSAEIPHKTRKHSSCSETKCRTTNVGSVELENTNDAYSKNDLIMTNNTAEDGGNENFKTVTMNAIRGNVHRAHRNPEPEEATSDALGSKTPIRHIFGNSNKTIETLIKIGTLAKEINDMIAAEGKVPRTGPNARSWDSIMGPQFLTMMGDYGGIIPMPPPPPGMIKTDEGNGKKDILISMKAKYQE